MSAPEEGKEDQRGKIWVEAEKADDNKRRDEEAKGENPATLSGEGGGSEATRIISSAGPHPATRVTHTQTAAEEATA